MRSTGDMIRRFCMAVTMAIAVCLTVSDAEATDWHNCDIPCSLCGLDYQSPFPVAYSQRGMRLDFQPIASSPAPWPLAACPQCGFIQFTHQLTDEEKSILEAFVRSAEYKALIETRPTYYRLAKLYEALGKDDLEIGHAYLRASWQEERQGNARAAEMRDNLESSLMHIQAYLAQGPNTPAETDPTRKGCLSAYQVAQLLKGELFRRLGQYDSAISYFTLLHEDPECQRDEVSNIIQFQLLLCRQEDSNPWDVGRHDWYRKNKAR